MNPSDRVCLVPWACFLLLAVAMVLGSSPARAQNTDACVASYERAQELHQAGKFVEARVELLVCAQPSCPRLTTPDCTRWLREVDEGVPSIVVSAKDAAGRDVVDVRISIDGRAAVDRLDGKGILVDPGEHTLRYERANEAAIEQKILARQGEKNRLITVVFPSHIPPPPIVETQVSPLAYALAALGIAAVGTGVALDAVATNDLSTLRNTCAPYCSTGARDRARTKMIVGDSSLALGAVSLGGAAWLFTHPKRTLMEGGARVSIRPVLRPASGGGGLFGVAGWF
jgi:hypothetical protein